MHSRNNHRAAGLAVLTVLLALLLSALPAALVAPLHLQEAVAAGTITNVSNNDGNSILPRIAVSGDGGNIYLVWQDSSSGNNEIFFTVSEDGGSNFTEPENISETDGFSSLPQISISGENVHVAWQDTSPANDIFVRSNTGSGFGEQINVSNTTDGASTSPQIAASGDNVYVAWQDSSTGNLEVLFAASEDGGASFSKAVNLSNTTTGVSVSPQIAVSTDGTIHVVWQDTSPASDIFITSSVNGGINFTQPVNVSDTDTGGSFSPRIAVKDDGSAIYVAWQDSFPGNNDIFFGSSSNGGSAFNVTNVSENDGVSTSPALIADPSTGKIYVTWADNTDTGGPFDVFLSSTTDGSDFTDPVNASSNSGQSTLPQVHLISGTDTVYLAWMDNTLDISNQEILLAPSPDGGETFGCAINVSNNPTSSVLPQLIIAPDSQTVHVVWQDPIEPGNFEVLLHSGLVLAETSMTIDEVSNSSPKWDLDVVEVSGTVGSGAETTDTVTVDWGDGTATEEIPVDGCDWGPVSHAYTSSALANNPNQLSAALFSANGTQKAAASPAEINVQKHSTTVTLNPVSSVVQGSEVSVTGSLEDADAAEGIGGQNITFSGTGAVGILEQATTESGGDAGAFSTTGTAQNATGSLQSVQAHFAGSDLYEDADSIIRTYDVVSGSAVQFNVTEADPFIDIAGFFAFNATIEFEELLSDGAVFVSECESPASGRYSSLDLCLSISSAVEMAEDTFARVTISYDGKLPQGASPEQVNIFHEELTTEGIAIVDITESRDLVAETVTGRTATFSTFVAGLAIHEPEPAGGHRTQVFVGDGNIAQLRDIDNLQNSSDTATAFFDKASYRFSDQPVLTIVDDNGNVNSDKQDIVVAGVKSESSDPDVLVLTLLENGTDTGVFKGSFSFTRDVTSSEDGVLHAASGEQLSIHYISGARAKVVIDGVIESGIAELSDSIVDEGVCLKPIGGAINLDLIDTQLGPEGLITVSLGYANSNLRGFDPSAFRMVHKEDAKWIDVTTGVDTDAMTVTGQSSTTGPFSIGVDVDDCSGGAGGGVSRPGTGLVLDFVASLAARASSGGGGGGSTSTQSTTTRAEEGNNVISSLETGAGSRVEIAFEQVSSVGDIYIKPVDERDLPSGAFSSSSTAGNTMNVDGSLARTVGTIYDITTSSGLVYEGSLLLTIPYDEVLTNSSSSEMNVRLMHFEDGMWEDTTVSINATANTVTGRLASLSPVVAAVVDDGTYGDAYHEIHPHSSFGASQPSLVDPSGDMISDDQSPQQIGGLVAPIVNMMRTEQPYVVLVQVLNEDGVVMGINSVSGILQRGENIDASINLELVRDLPNGNYSVHVFVFDSISGETIQMLAPAQLLTTNISDAN